jgi:hypothetical protein
MTLRSVLVIFDTNLCNVPLKLRSLVCFVFELVHRIGYKDDKGPTICRFRNLKMFTHFKCMLDISVP